MTQKILYSKPSITELEVEYTTDVARNGWGGQCYAYTNRSEKWFVAFVDTQYAIATSSCTGVMYMGPAASGTGAGDEVILADTNWITMTSLTTYVGTMSVSVGILSDMQRLDPAPVEAAITSRIKTIIVTHLYGSLCKMDRLLDTSRHHGIPVIGNMAEAAGSRWHGHTAGSQGTLDTFSFHGTKTITTGEGGMFVTSDRVLCDRVMTLNNHGHMPGGKQFWSDFIDFKYHVSNMQAAIDCTQFERIDALVACKRKIFAGHQAYLGGIANLALNPEAPGALNSYQMPTVVFDEALGITRGGLLAVFSRHGIDARVLFYPPSQVDLFGNASGSVPNNCAIAEHAINLPSYHDMSNTDIGAVSQVMLDLVQEHQERQTCLTS